MQGSNKSVMPALLLLLSKPVRRISGRFHRHFLFYVLNTENVNIT